MIKSVHEYFCRDGQNTTRQMFKGKDEVVPFEIRIQLPKPRKEPIITQRDGLGRIIEAQFPTLRYK